MNKIGFWIYFSPFLIFLIWAFSVELGIKKAIMYVILGVIIWFLVGWWVEFSEKIGEGLSKK